MPLFLWTESPARSEAADDAWWVAEVYAAAVERRKAGAAADDAT
jgi:hypothetical protein